MKIILLVAILFFSFNGYNQTWQWTHPEPNGIENSNSNIYLGDETDDAHDVETDASGNVYVLGNFIDSLYLNNVFRQKGAGSYLAKYDSTGKLLWYKTIVPSDYNSNKNIKATDLAVNAQGVFITGKYFPSYYTSYDCNTGENTGVDFSYKIGSYNFTSARNDVGFFVTKLNTGGGVVWNKTATEPVCYDGGQPGQGSLIYNPLITSDKNNNVICEFMYFPGKPGLQIGGNNIPSPPPTNNGAFMIFKMGSNGDIKWSNYAANAKYTSVVHDCNSITTDNNGNTFLYGLASDSCQFGSIYYRAHFRENEEGIIPYSVFIAKISSAGQWQFAKELFDQGQTFLEGGVGNPDFLTTDNSNNVYALANLRGNGIYGVITGDTVSTDQTNTYLIKLKNNGDLVWHKGFASSDTYANSIYFKNNSLYISGGIRNYVYNGKPWLFSDLTVKSSSPDYSGAIEYFVAKATTNLAFQWVTSFSGSYNLMEGFSVKALGDNIYTAGFYTSHIETLGNLNGTYNNPYGSTHNLFFGKLKDQYIKVGAITPTALNAGCTITIPFTSYGLIFSNNNTFTAELSDVNGNFTNPTVIGSTTSTGTGSITATIPATLSYGSGYVVRIKSSDTLKTGFSYYAYADTGYKITLLCPPPSALTNTNITSSSAKLNWHTVDCAKGYSLKYKVNTAANWTTVNITTNTGTYNLTGLTANTTYQWKVATKCKPANTAYYSKNAGTHSFTTAAAAGFATAGAQAAQLKTSGVIVYPNPANNNAIIIFNTNKSTKYKLQLTDVSGKVLQTKTGETINGENKVMLDISKYAQGMYIIDLTDDEYGKRTLKLNKQ